MLTEKLLQFLWQFQYYNNQNLRTDSGENLIIVSPGTYNVNQGPDFLNAKIQIGDTLWAGNIELHIKASDWYVHKHASDANYQNIILHVVWDQDVSVTDRNGTALPSLHIEPLVSKLMLKRYEDLMNSKDFVPCQSSLPLLSPIGWQSWQERQLIQRLEKRSTQILERLSRSENHWEEIFWHLLARNFGMPVNADAFENIAQTIPVSMLAKHKNQVQQVEALLLGQGYFLEGEFEDEYVKLLQREYKFLRNKFNLKSTGIKPQMLRMRPANFPTVRLAQLAMLIHKSEHLFSKILELKDSKEVIALLNVTANDFWHYHYQLSVKADYKPKVLGVQMAENILINTIVPVVFAYGLYQKNQTVKDKAVDWLAQTAGEINTVIKNWKALGVESNNALQTQGLLELKKHYCDEKKCLRCAVGNKLLKLA